MDKGKCGERFETPVKSVVTKTDSLTAECGFEAPVKSMITKTAQM